MVIRLAIGCALALALIDGPAFAQTSRARPAPAVEFLAGYAGFADDATIDHGIVGAAARGYVTPRLAIGPELVYMRGPNSDRDLFLTGNLTFDVLRPQAGQAARVTPFLVAGGGLMEHSDQFGNGTYRSYEGAFTAGGGVRGWMTPRVYAFGDVRVGWELHVRVNGGVGFRMGG
jgi:hypothetical protein